MTGKKILILTHEDDPHAESIHKYFDSKKVEYFTVVTENLLKDYKINFSSSGLMYTI